MSEKNIQLKIEYVALDELKPYEKNAKLHPEYQIKQIQKSIEKFGMKDPIGVWKSEIVEGHGRYAALMAFGEEKLKEMGLDKVPVIRLDDLNANERRAYALAHNKLTMNSGFDFANLSAELKELDEFDMGDFGFGDFEIDSLSEDFEPDPLEDIGDEYGEADTVSHNVIISCINEEQKEFVKILIRETGRLQKLYDCKTIMERYGQ